MAEEKVEMAAAVPIVARPKFLRVYHNQLQHGNLTHLNVVLFGHVTEKYISLVNSALVEVRKIDVLLASLPDMRVVGDLWTFSTTAPGRFYATILINVFARTAQYDGWIIEERRQFLEEEFQRIRAMRQRLLYNTHPGHAAFKGALPPQIERPPRLEKWEQNLHNACDEHYGNPCLSFIRKSDEGEIFRPMAGHLYGGLGKEIVKNPMGSMSVLTGSTYNLADGDVFMFGVGWDTRKSKVHEMLSRYGVGITGQIDLDVNIYPCNSYGEMMLRVPLSPKNASWNKLDGVTMGLDNQSGRGVHDDETFVLELRKIPPRVQSLLLTVSLQKGAYSFSHIRNMFMRLLDVNSGSSPVEIWRYKMDNLAQAPEHKYSAVLCRFERSEAGGWAAVLMQDYVKEKTIGCVELRPGDVLTHINGTKVNPCAGMGKQNTFKFNMETLGKNLKYGVTTLTIRRPEQLLPPKRMHRKDLQIPRSGETFNLTFDPDGDSNIGISFRECRASVVVESVDPRNFDPHVDHTRICNLAVTKRCAAPKFVEISEIEAMVPAADVSGTTDVYLRIGFRTAKKSVLGRAAPGRDYNRTEIIKSKTQVKVRCPKVVTFKESARIPVSSYVGMLDKCEIDIMDKDTVGKDDVLIRHKVDLTYYFANGCTEEFVKCTPTEMTDIRDVKANAGFTRNDIFIKFKLKLITE